jgi:hypothetical protein
MVFMYQEEAEGGRGAELAYRIINNIIIITTCNNGILIHTFI